MSTDQGWQQAYIRLVQRSLLLDTSGLTPMRVLAERATCAPTVLTLLLRTPTGWLLPWLAPTCPTISALVSEDGSGALSPASWRGGASAAAPAAARLWETARAGPAPSDSQVLATLVALAHAPRIDAAAKPCALLDRAFSQTLAMLQTALRVPTRMDRGRAALLLQTILEALAVDMSHMRISPFRH